MDMVHASAVVAPSMPVAAMAGVRIHYRLRLSGAPQGGLWIDVPAAALGPEPEEQQLRWNRVPEASGAAECQGLLRGAESVFACDVRALWDEAPVEEWQSRVTSAYLWLTPRWETVGRLPLPVTF
eukprot:gene13595-22894_t